MKTAILHTGMKINFSKSMGMFLKGSTEISQDKKLVRGPLTKREFLRDQKTVEVHTLTFFQSQLHFDISGFQININ